MVFNYVSSYIVVSYFVFKFYFCVILLSSYACNLIEFLILSVTVRSYILDVLTSRHSQFSENPRLELPYQLSPTAEPPPQSNIVCVLIMDHFMSLIT